MQEKTEQGIWGLLFVAYIIKSPQHMVYLKALILRILFVMDEYEVAVIG